VKLLIISVVFACAAFAADIKNLPNQAGNGDIDIAGNVFLEPNEIQEILGAPMDPGYVVVRVKVTPRMLQAIRISPDDFTLVSRKNGERSSALAPNPIAGSADLVLRRETTRTTVGVDPVKNTTSSIKAAPEGTKKGSNNSLMKVLESKILADTETKEPVEGLLYFLLEGKNKAKDLGLLYKGPAGHLAMDFK
jgi:hypothetical protein